MKCIGHLWTALMAEEGRFSEGHGIDTILLLSYPYNLYMCLFFNSRGPRTVSVVAYCILVV